MTVTIIGMILCLITLPTVTTLQERTTQTRASLTKPASSGWILANKSRSPMDDSLSLAYRLSAINVIRGRLGTHRPSILARCQERSLDVYIDFGMVMNGAVRYRFDSGGADTDYWDTGTDYEALFARDPVFFASQLAKAKRLRVEVTPYSGSPQVVEFSVTGFAGPLKQLASVGCAPAIADGERRASQAAERRSAEDKRETARNKRNADEQKQFGKLVFLSAAAAAQATTFHAHRGCLRLHGEPRPILISELTIGVYNPCPSCKPSVEGMKR